MGCLDAKRRTVISRTQSEALQHYRHTPRPLICTVKKHLLPEIEEPCGGWGHKTKAVAITSLKASGDQSIGDSAR